MGHPATNIDDDGTITLIFNLVRLEIGSRTKGTDCFWTLEDLGYFMMLFAKKNLSPCTQGIQ